MKKTAMLALVCLALPCAAALAQSQAVREYQFPSAQGSKSPPSTLRITEGAAPGRAASTGIVRDTPESLGQYQRCRMESDRAAITNADREGGLMRCMNELQMRREQGAVTQ